MTAKCPNSTKVQESSNGAASAVATLQRKCACGRHTIAGSGCYGCKNQQTQPALARPSAASADSSRPEPNGVPLIVHEVLRSPGRPLDGSTRAFFEPRFARDFSRVRVHTDARAAESAGTVNALAYTVGHDIVFNADQYTLATPRGRQLVAHELTHVAQQQDHASVASLSEGEERFEREAEMVSAAVTNRTLSVRERSTVPFLGKTNARETAAVLRQGTVRNTGLQFFPLQIRSTRIGPASGEGGMAENTHNNLIVIVGQSISLRRVASLLLPLWNSATPFTPPGATAPLANPALTADVLARGLLVYNRYYLRVVSQPGPAVTGLSGGLRFPLPIEIDENGDAVVNSDLIRNLAGEFDAAWEPLLDQAASAVVTSAAASLNQEVTAFLAATPDADDRGISLAVRALQNPVEALPFVREVFNRLGGDAFVVALAYMDSSLNAQIGLLASQRAGAGILGVLRRALANSPSQLSARQQQSLTRANQMLGLVRAVAAREMPFTQPDAVSATGVRMIRALENFCANLYDDGMRGCGLGRGHCTIGWGHLVHTNPCDGRASETPFLGGITRLQADQLLAGELTATVNRVRNQVTVPLSQQQFDAVVSFVFNTGRLNALLPDLNGNHFANIPGIMNQFTHSQGQVMGGLVTRRAAEATLFSTGVYPP